MAQEANKKITVRVNLNDTVYIVDGQGLYKTYINSIYCKQWSDTAGNIIQQITYGVPGTELGTDVTNKFVIGDFGETIFTNITAAYQKFEGLSPYASENNKTITSSSLRNEEVLSAGSGNEAITKKEVVLSTNDPEGICNYDCYNCDKYDQCNKKEKRDKTINVGTGKSDITDYIKIKNNIPDIPVVPAKILADSVSARGTYTYYDSTGALVASSTGVEDDYTSYINTSGEKAVGDIMKVKYYDVNNNIIFRLGDKYDVGPFVYQIDGSAVPIGTEVFHKIELVGNANIGTDGITYNSQDSEYYTGENNNIIDISEP